MKTKKILLGSLLVLATAMTAANLWAESEPPPQPMEQCKWRIVPKCNGGPHWECVFEGPAGPDTYCTKPLCEANFPGELPYDYCEPQ